MLLCHLRDLLGRPRESFARKRSVSQATAIGSLVSFATIPSLDLYTVPAFTPSFLYFQVALSNTESIPLRVYPTNREHGANKSSCSSKNDKKTRPGLLMVDSSPTSHRPPSRRNQGQLLLVVLSSRSCYRQLSFRHLENPQPFPKVCLGHRRLWSQQSRRLCHGHSFRSRRSLPVFPAAAEMDLHHTTCGSLPNHDPGCPSQAGQLVHAWAGGSEPRDGVPPRARLAVDE